MTENNSTDNKEILTGKAEVSVTQEKSGIGATDVGLSDYEGSDAHVTAAPADAEPVYDESSIQTLEWTEHMRRRPTMYIGALGNGSRPDDGIYVLLKEVIDNTIDEFNMGAGKRVDITLDAEAGRVTVRDYGRGIPLGKVKVAASVINTGGKFDSKAFQKSVGLNGVGLKAVNALSEQCRVRSVRDGKSVTVDFARGVAVDESMEDTSDPNGTEVTFQPDQQIFPRFRFVEDTVRQMVSNYTYLNTGLSIYLNGERFISRHGLLDLLRENLTSEPLYPIIHLKGEDIEVVLTHTDQHGEEYYSFVNGQHTTQGGTHLAAFREAVSRTVKEFSGKNYEYPDIRNGIVAAVSVRIQEPMFESQTKIKLSSNDTAPDSGISIKKFVGDFIKKELDDYLHKNQATAEAMLAKIAATEKERKAMAGVAKLARERAKKVSLHNRKLRDCRIHYNDQQRGGKNTEDDPRQASAIFITEGDSASGTITKVRNAETQAVFSLRGKPLNSYGMTREVVYKNEEFNLLQAALNIENGIEGLRYNKVIIATDADVDGMHIRLLIITFFLMFFPELIKKGHVYILQTPLFRVRDKRLAKRSKSGKGGVRDATTYCYTEEERIAALARLGQNAEITRFKGLGEINQEEFADFIGEGMRLDPVKLRKGDATDKLMEFYMGKNTPDRQSFIIDNLVVEDV